MSTITNVVTLTTPQTILGTVYDSIAVSPQVQTNYQTGVVRVQVSLVASGSIPTQQNAIVAKQYSLQPTSFDFPAIFQAAISASGYEVV